jgi:dTDP-4-amino-4,6-dideoxygalactose transaminase
MIPIARPTLGRAEADAAAAAVLSGWVSQGPQVAAFEAEFAAAVDAPHACAVSNCTTALHLACLALNIGPGDEVVTVSHSFVAGANAIRQTGAVPVFVDIEAGGFNIDPSAVAAAIGPKTRAVLCVHQIGMPCDLPALLTICEAHDLPLIEDAACAIGSEIRIGDDWQRIGRPHGAVACFSFHPRKVLTTGEGGMLTTRDPAIDARARLWRQHGMSVSDTARHAAAEVTFEAYPERGYNYRMTDIQAAVGRQQLQRLDGIVHSRRVVAQALAARLADCPGITLPGEPDWARSNWQSFCVTLDARLDQRAVMQAMLDRGVATRRGIMCMHLEESQRDVPLRHPLPRSEAARDRGLLLPLHADLTEGDIDTVARVLREVITAALRPVAIPA